MDFIRMTAESAPIRLAAMGASGVIGDVLEVTHADLCNAKVGDTFAPLLNSQQRRKALYRVSLKVTRVFGSYVYFYSLVHLAMRCTETSLCVELA